MGFFGMPLATLCPLLLKFPLLEVYGDVGFAGLGLGLRENFHHFFVSLWLNSWGSCTSGARVLLQGGEKGTPTPQKH